MEAEGPVRICLLCYRGNPYCGGQGIYLKYVAEELVRQGHEVHAIVGPPAPPAMRGVTVHYVPNNEYYVKKGASVINPERPFDIFDPVTSISTRPAAWAPSPRSARSVTAPSRCCASCRRRCASM